ncbi:MAG: phosphatase [Eubacteriales bacterium]|nr:phosphatase [Eubacteriales bacterium]
MYLSDLHTHSIASGHGTTSTISDMAKMASIRGLKLLGITDHGPATLAAGTPSYFRSVAYSPRQRFHVDILYGIELNILDIDGHVDLEPELLQNLDYAIASMHSQNFRPRSLKENTRAFLNVMQNPHVKILGHCDNSAYPVDYEAIISHANETGTIPEINEASLAPYGYRGDTRSNCRKILHFCQKYNVPVILSSDSHGTDHIGDFTYAAEFIHSEMFPESLILNNQIPTLKAFLQTR